MLVGVATEGARAAEGGGTPPPTTPATPLRDNAAPSAQPAPASSAAVPVPAGASAGLANQWLRQQSEVFTPWDLGGQYRLRYENKENAGSFPNRDFVAEGLDNSNDYLLQRLKVHLGYTPFPWLTAYVEGRNSVVDFDKRVPSSESDKYDLHQAYLALGDPQLFPLTAKVGRQELLYADERFVGVSDWSNAGRVFDAAKLRYENPRWWLDAFTGRVILPYDDHFNVPNDYDWFSGLYASTADLIPWQQTQLYLLSRNTGTGSPTAVTPTVGGSAARDVYTLGTLWKSLPGKLGGWDYSAELVGQLGSVNSGGAAGRRKDLEAYGAFVSGGYTWAKTWGAPRLGLGYDYGSGNHDPNSGTTHTFENLFGTAHRFYGVMDLMGPRNTSSPRLTTSIKPVKGLTLTADYLLFWLADTQDYLYPETAAARSANGYGLHPGYCSFVGSELDLVATYTFKTYGDLQLGYGHFFVGDYIRQSVSSVAKNGGTADANWIYVQARVNF